MTFPLLSLAFLIIGVASISGARYTRRYALFGVSGSAALLFLHGYVYLDYISDDAFIYFRYARNLADGYGPIWNPGGERVEGYTGILWLLPLAGASKLGVNLPGFAQYVGFALSVGSLAMLYPIARRLPGGGRLPLAPVVAGIALAASHPFAVWTFGGLETPLFVLLLLVGVWLHLREEEKPGRFPFSGAAFAFAMMARPEGILFAAVSGLFKLAGLVDRETRVPRARDLVLWAGLLGGLYGAYFGWRSWYYGYLLPNTFYAKVGSGIDYYNRGLDYLARQGGEYGLLLLAVGLLAYIVWARPIRPALYLAFLAAAWAAWVVQTGGDSLVGGRFLLPVMPVLTLGAALALLHLASGQETARQRPAVIAVAGVLATYGLLYPSSTAAPLVIDREGHEASVITGQWMREHLPEDTTIAVIRAGAVPYYSQLPTIDMLGLNDTHIAHADVELGNGYPGHEKHDTEYVLSREPDIVLLRAGATAPPFYSWEQYLANRWSFAAQRAFVGNATARAQYRPVALELKPGQWLSILVRSDAESLLGLLCLNIGDVVHDVRCGTTEAGGPPPHG
jgi:hypothetical protein